MAQVFWRNLTIILLLLNVYSYTTRLEGFLNIQKMDPNFFGPTYFLGLGGAVLLIAINFVAALSLWRKRRLGLYLCIFIFLLVAPKLLGGILRTVISLPIFIAYPANLFLLLLGFFEWRPFMLIFPLCLFKLRRELI